MKKNINLILATIICLFVSTILLLQSCSETELDSLTLENIPESYKMIGTMHNEGLEYFFKDIRTFYAINTKNGHEKILNKVDYKAMYKRSITNFCKSNKISNTSAQFYEELFDNAERKTSLRSNNTVPINEEIVKLQEEINAAIAKDGDKKDLVKFQKSLDEINKKATNTLSEIDAIAIYAATSTAFSSYIYWKENHTKWQIALNHPELLELYSDDELNKLKIKNVNLNEPESIKLKSWWGDAWGAVGEAWDTGATAMTDWWNNGGSDVVAADAGGAVTGAMAGAIGGLATAGTLSGPAAIAGGISGGCYTSIQETIEQWIKR
ncbi:hypothetical protein EZS27_003667 [termite gut metagenome]|uniref:Uncharacterized protein n=1 Tax=termite gut metagenome TaxID=433724 RepID=A0A5J4SS73_9ZZZZ